MQASFSGGSVIIPLNSARQTSHAWTAPILVGLLLFACSGKKFHVGSSAPDRPSPIKPASDTDASGHAEEAGVGGGNGAATHEPSLVPADAGLEAGLSPTFALEPPLAFDGQPIFSEYVRLTHVQWENSVVDNLRLDTATGYLSSLPPDPWARYSNNELALTVGTALALNYQAAAADIAQRVALDATALDRVSSSRDPEEFVAEVGRRFFRRPLTSEEQATYLDLFETGMGLADSEANAFAEGARLAIEGWMQSPNFLYRVEQSEGTLNGFEVATRLAYLLTDSTPSDSLLDAAEGGALDASSGVEAAARELMNDARATLVFRRFHDETFVLRRLMDVSFADQLGLPSTLGADLGEAANLFFDHLFLEGFGLRELLLSRVAFANPTLAAFYGTPAPASSDFQRFDAGPMRRGFFAQLPILMLDSVGETPNPFRRGARFVRYVLCQNPVPPADIVPVLPQAIEGGTNRQRASAVVSPPQCFDCHQLTDPFGFAFENFDGLGRLRTEDNGLPVDSTGVYPYSEGIAFADSAELMAILAESPLAHGCYAKNLTEFTMARSLTKDDAPLVTELQQRSSAKDASLVELITALVSSEGYRTRKASP